MPDDQLIRDLVKLQKEVEQLKAAEGPRFSQSVANVGNPPTDAQLDSAFGTPTAVGDGFIGMIDDADGGANYWLCCTVNGAWAYVALTLAV